MKSKAPKTSLHVVLATAHPIQQPQDKRQNKTTKPTPEQLQNSCCLLFHLDPSQQHIAVLGTERLIWNWKTVKKPWWVVAYRHYAYDLRLKPIIWGEHGHVSQEVWLLSGFFPSVLGFFGDWCWHHGPFSPRPNGCSRHLGASYTKLRLGGISLQINFPEGPKTHKHQAHVWCQPQPAPSQSKDQIAMLQCWSFRGESSALERPAIAPSFHVRWEKWQISAVNKNLQDLVYRFYCLHQAPHAWHTSSSMFDSDRWLKSCCTAHSLLER